MVRATYEESELERALRLLIEYLGVREKLRTTGNNQLLLTNNLNHLTGYIEGLLALDTHTTNVKELIGKTTDARDRMATFYHRDDPDKAKFKRWIIAMEDLFAIEPSEHTRGWDEARKAAILTYTPPTQSRWHLPATLLILGLAGYPAYLVVEHKPWQSITALKHSVTESVIVLLSLVLLSCIAYDKCQDQSSVAPAKVCDVVPVKEVPAEEALVEEVSL